VKVFGITGENRNYDYFNSGLRFHSVFDGSRVIRVNLEKKGERFWIEMTIDEANRLYRELQDSLEA
jgi:hypothetical protein